MMTRQRMLDNLARIRSAGGLVQDKSAILNWLLQYIEASGLTEMGRAKVRQCGDSTRFIAHFPGRRNLLSVCFAIGLSGDITWKLSPGSVIDEKYEREIEESMSKDGEGNVAAVLEALLGVYEDKLPHRDTWLFVVAADHIVIPGELDAANMENLDALNPVLGDDEDSGICRFIQRAYAKADKQVEGQYETSHIESQQGELTYQDELWKAAKLAYQMIAING